MPNSLTTLDTAITLIFLIVTAYVGLHYSGNEESDASAYFLAGRNVRWFIIGASLVGADILNALFLGSGFGTGAGLFSLGAEFVGILFLFVLGGRFFQRYLAQGVWTTPEYVERRFDRRTHVLVTLSSLFVMVGARIALTFLVGSFFFAQWSRIEISSLLAIVVMVSGIPVIVGGFRSAMHIQGFGAIVAVGGILTAAFLAPQFGVAMDAAFPNLSPSVSMMASSTSRESFSWLGMILGVPLFAFWYWGVDQYIVQHVLGSSNAREASHGLRLTAILKTLLMVSTVAIAGLFSGRAAHSMSAGTSGFQRAVVVTVLAAMVSSLAGAFSSSSALVTFDLYRPSHPNASAKKLVLVGRLVTAGVIVLAILWIPLVRVLRAPDYGLLRSAMILIASPIAAVYLLGMFWRKASVGATYWALAITEGVVVIKLALAYAIRGGDYANAFLKWFLETRALEFSVYLVGTFLAIVAFGMLTEHHFAYKHQVQEFNPNA